MSTDDDAVEPKEIDASNTQQNMSSHTGMYVCINNATLLILSNIEEIYTEPNGIAVASQTDGEIEQERQNHFNITDGEHCIYIASIHIIDVNAAGIED